MGRTSLAGPRDGATAFRPFITPAGRTWPSSTWRRIAGSLLDAKDLQELSTGGPGKPASEPGGRLGLGDGAGPASPRDAGIRGRGARW